MTISTVASESIALGNGATYTFSFNFIADSAADIQVIYTNTSGAQTILSPSVYTLNITAPAAGALWGVGGTVTYPLSGSAIANGTSLTIQRIVPLTQTTSISNQGNFDPQVIETAMDTLCMEIQQVSARTGQMRGNWATGILYNFGDIVVDSSNGANTGNYYMCAIANTSGVWATNLAAGDWSLVINIQGINAVIGAYLPLIGGTITGNLTVNGTTNPSGGITANTVPNTALAQMVANTIKANTTNSTANAADFTMGASTILARLSTGNIIAATASQISTLLNIPANVATSITGLLPTAISGNSTTAAITVSGGYCSDSNNFTLMNGSAGYSWAVSNGNAALGYHGGTALPNSATIHVGLIQGASGVTVFADNQLPLRPPTGYTTYQRRIFSFNTTNAGAPIPYNADEVEGGALQAFLATQLLDITTSSLLSASTQSFTLTVPTGIKMGANYRASINTGSTFPLLTSPDETNVAPINSSPFTTAPGNDGAVTSSVACSTIRDGLMITNTSGQINARASGATSTFYWVTRGFRDFRRA